MRLSQLQALCDEHGLVDPIVVVAVDDGMPVDIKDVDPGVGIVDGHPVSYVCLVLERDEPEG